MFKQAQSVRDVSGEGGAWNVCPQVNTPLLAAVTITMTISRPATSSYLSPQCLQCY